jgi:proteasome lid subunit RPN8/RPN11
VIAIGARQLHQIARAAEAAYPEECCGLLVGEGDEGGEGGERRWRVARVEASANLAEGDRRRRFEVDPRLLIRLHRELRGGETRVIGVYHSHPDHPAEPSAHDLELALEPGMVWLITSVMDGRARHTMAHVVVEGGQRFDRIPLTEGG